MDIHLPRQMEEVEVVSLDQPGFGIECKFYLL